MRYNKNYDYVIAKTLYNNNFKKAVAFKVASEILSTTPKSIEGRYYRHKDEINAYIEDLKNKPVNPIVKFFKKLFGIID